MKQPGHCVPLAGTVVFGWTELQSCCASASTTQSAIGQAGCLGENGRRGEERRGGGRKEKGGGADIVIAQSVLVMHSLISNMPPMDQPRSDI